MPTLGGGVPLAAARDAARDAQGSRVIGAFNYTLVPSVKVPSPTSSGCVYSMSFICRMNHRVERNGVLVSHVHSQPIISGYAPYTYAPNAATRKPTWCAAEE